MKQRDDYRLTETIIHELGRGDPFAAAVRATRMPMVFTDPSQPDNPIIFCNGAFQQLTGYAREEVVGRNCRFLQGPETDRAAVARIREAIEQGVSIEIDLLNYRKDGSTFWNALYLSPVRNEAGEVRFFLASQLNVSERISAQAEINRQKLLVEREVARRTTDLRAALEAKTLLLHEVDHRVRNNLTMIGSLLRLQARSIADPVISAKLSAMLERVDALATVHRRLYQSEDVTRFDIGAFSANLLADVIGADGRQDIETVVDVEPIAIASSQASALGLVLNEIVTNAVRHAFPDGGGTIRLAGSVTDGVGTISVEDDGRGMGKAQPHDTGHGQTLINRLSRQVGATATWVTGPEGTRVALSFPTSG